MKSYHEIIIKEFMRRRSLDRKYSQRNFAEDLGIKYVLLSKVLSKEKGLSVRNAFQVGRKLGLNMVEAKEFRFLVSEQSGRSRYERNLAKQWLRLKSSGVERHKTAK